MIRRSGSRRTARTGDAAEPIGSIFAASAGAGETAREQDRPDHGERDRGERREAHVERAGAVEQERDPDGDDGHAGYQGDEVDPFASPHRLARRSRTGPVADAVGHARVVVEGPAAAGAAVETLVLVADLE